MPIADGTLIAAHLARVHWDRVYLLDSRRYSADYLPSRQADLMPWRHFVEAVPRLTRGMITGSGLDVVVVPKSLTWSDRDVNVYIGRPAGMPVRCFLDLGEDGFVEVFAWHVAVACQLSATLGCDVYVTHGFNPQDTAPDAHSLATKFHTHLHIPDLVRRRPARVRELSEFDRLTLIEPFAAVFWDAVARFLAERPAAPRWRFAQRLGFLTAVVPLDDQVADDLRLLCRLLNSLGGEYQQIVRVFAAGDLETVTGHHRLIPLPPRQRLERLNKFEADNVDWLSDESLAVLRYLARNLVHAQARDSLRSTRIRTAAQAWIAKGLSGALNLVVSAERNSLRFDFAPRIISTSGATKVISTDPTIIRKDRGPASAADQRRMTDYHQAVVAAVATQPHRIPTQGRRLPSTSSSVAPPGSSA